MLRLSMNDRKKRQKLLYRAQDDLPFYKGVYHPDGCVRKFADDVLQKNSCKHASLAVVHPVNDCRLYFCVGSNPKTVKVVYSFTHF